jgi:hypothetical protein
MKAYLKKYANGMLMLEKLDGDDAAPRLKVGEVVSVEWHYARNYERLKAIMKLFRIAYDHYCEYAIDEGVEYKGQKVLPSFDTFRGELVILAGHYVPTFDIHGRLKLDAQSLSYEKCSQRQFEKIFGDVIGAAIKHVYKNTRSPESLRQQVVDEIAKFAPHEGG